jgi:hypothetical protein
MKKIFENGWVTFGAMMTTAIVDLIAIPGIDFGAGFVLAFAYFIALGINQARTKG